MAKKAAKSKAPKPATPKIADAVRAPATNLKAAKVPPGGPANLIRARKSVRPGRSHLEGFNPLTQRWGHLLPGFVLSEEHAKTLTKNTNKIVNAAARFLSIGMEADQAKIEALLRDDNRDLADRYEIFQLICYAVFNDAGIDVPDGGIDFGNGLWLFDFVNGEDMTTSYELRYAVEPDAGKLPMPDELQPASDASLLDTVLLVNANWKSIRDYIAEQRKAVEEHRCEEETAAKDEEPTDSMPSEATTTELPESLTGNSGRAETFSQPQEEQSAQTV